MGSSRSPIVLARQPIRKWRIPINTSSALLAVVLAALLAAVLVAVLAVVLVAVLVAVLAVVLAVVLVAGVELYFVSYTRCDLFSTLMSSLPFRFN